MEDWDKPGTFAAFILKISDSGEEEWSKVYDYYRQDIASTDIMQTIDGGFISGGSKIFKVDKLGNLLWLIEREGFDLQIIGKDKYLFRSDIRGGLSI